MNDTIAGRIILRPGKDKPVRQRHPWIFSGAIRKVEGDPRAGAVVEVRNERGAWLAYAEYSPHSQIRARVFAWEQDQRLGLDFWRKRIIASIERRKQLLPPAEARRLVFAESDGIPGLIVDQYGPHLVIQILTAGAERRKGQTVQILADYLHPHSISERDDPVRKKEGLPPSEGLLWGESPAAQVTISEGRQRFLVDLRSGQKTGFYLDQAQNRTVVASYCRDAEVLNAFSYTGAFAVHALAAGARHVINVDSSAEVLAVAAANFALNDFSAARWQNIGADVFMQLRQWRDEGRQFDLIILDPPKFASNRRQIDKAARGYKDINWLAMRLLRPGGLLASFSCSGLVSADLFQKILFGAALDARRDVRIIRRFTQAPDHPVLLSFPESAYLKGLLCHVA